MDLIMSKILFNNFKIYSFFPQSVSECYKNEKRIDHACKQLTSQSNLLIKQSQAWITLIGQFTDALKVCFVVSNK